MFIKSVFEVLLRLLGPVFVLLGFSLISFAVYVHFTFVLSWYSGESVLSLSLFSLFHLLVDIWLCIGIAWNYFKSAVTPPLKFDVELSPTELAAIESSSVSQSSRTNMRYCKYCASITPFTCPKTRSDHKADASALSNVLFQARKARSIAFIIVMFVIRTLPIFFCYVTL